MIKIVGDLYVRLDERYPAHTKIFRFLLSGSTAFGTDIIFLYLFTDIFGIWYLASAIIAFVFAFFVSFVLHKFWTFGDRSQEGMHMQMGAYLFVAVVNLSLNTLLVNLFVEQTGLHYIIAQILASALIAIESFFVYQRFIFKTAV